MQRNRIIFATKIVWSKTKEKSPSLADNIVKTGLRIRHKVLNSINTMKCTEKVFI
jgi:hypothetical protein